jgi:hypothetical protein
MIFMEKISDELKKWRWLDNNVKEDHKREEEEVH